jgi:hypothetical protein
VIFDVADGGNTSSQKPEQLPTRFSGVAFGSSVGPGS